MILSSLKVCEQVSFPGSHAGWGHAQEPGICIYIVTTCHADVYLASFLRRSQALQTTYSQIIQLLELLHIITFLPYHQPPHIAVAHIDQEVPCREHHNNIQNWKHKPQGEHILLYVCKANRCALDTLCVIDFRLNYKVRAQRVQSSRSCHDTKCSLLVMRYITD